MELCKRIAGFEKYQISSCGRIWFDKKNGFMKPTKDTKGYLRISIREACRNT